MGVGIAYVFAAAGFDTLVVEPDGGRASELARVIQEQATNGRERGKRLRRCSTSAASAARR
jgi:3-hydroxybutyryl-CoA dehydrogenase